MIKKIIAVSTLVPALALSLFAVPALADTWLGLTVINTNTASVVNAVSVTSSSGSNTANGGDGSSAGDGGDVISSDDNNLAGAGGAGGDGGAGGTIDTGAALSLAVISNDLNVNETDVDSCACENGDDDSAEVLVENSNAAEVVNAAAADADTGNNVADGGNSADYEDSSAGDGGDVIDSEDGNGGGAGGNAGAGGAAGAITTWDAASGVDILTVMNRNVLRVRH